MVASQSGYASYLLRLRRVHNDLQPIWVASIQCPMTGEQRSFASVGELVHFLLAEFGCDTIVDINNPEVTGLLQVNH